MQNVLLDTRRWQFLKPSGKINDRNRNAQSFWSKSHKVCRGTNFSSKNKFSSESSSLHLECRFDISGWSFFAQNPQTFFPQSLKPIEKFTRMVKETACSKISTRHVECKFDKFVESFSPNFQKKLLKFRKQKKKLLIL